MALPLEVRAAVRRLHAPAVALVQGRVGGVRAVRGRCVGGGPRPSDLTTKNRVTPAADQDILRGVTRRQVSELPAEDGERMIDRSVDRSELTSSRRSSAVPVHVVPVVEVDRRPVGDGRPGERTLRQIDTLAAIAWRDTDAHREWTTPVRGSA